MSKETTEGCGAVAGRVERPVRPCAWTLRTELDARETTCRAHLWFSDPVNSAWAPLYDQAALDAAVAEANRRQNAAWKLMAEKMVAAERERWRALLRTPHRMAGGCPDEVAGDGSRDLDCPACRLMLELGA